MAFHIRIVKSYGEEVRHDLRNDTHTSWLRSRLDQILQVQQQNRTRLVMVQAVGCTSAHHQLMIIKNKYGTGWLRASRREHQH